MQTIPQLNKEKPKVVNLEPVGLGNTEISTDYAQNPPRTMFLDIQIFHIFGNLALLTKMSQLGHYETIRNDGNVHWERS